AGLGAVLALALSADESEPAWVRVLASALLVPLSSALLLTLSRGAIAATVAGLVVYVLVARPRGLPSALFSGVPAAAIGVLATYRADQLVGEDVRGAAALSQGHHLAVVLAACATGAALARLPLLLLDRRLSRFRPSPRAARAGAVVAGGVGLAPVVDAGGRLDAPGKISRQDEAFVSDTTRPGQESDPR